MLTPLTDNISIHEGNYTHLNFNFGKAAILDIHSVVLSVHMPTHTIQIPAAIITDVDYTFELSEEFSQGLGKEIPYTYDIKADINGHMQLLRVGSFTIIPMYPAARNQVVKSLKDITDTLSIINNQLENITTRLSLIEHTLQNTQYNISIPLDTSYARAQQDILNAVHNLSINSYNAEPNLVPVVVPNNIVVTPEINIPSEINVNLLENNSPTSEVFGEEVSNESIL